MIPQTAPDSHSHINSPTRITFLAGDVRQRLVLAESTLEATVLQTLKPNPTSSQAPASDAHGRSEISGSARTPSIIARSRCERCTCVCCCLVLSKNASMATRRRVCMRTACFGSHRTSLCLVMGPPHRLALTISGRQRASMLAAQAGQRQQRPNQFLCPCM